MSDTKIKDINIGDIVEEYITNIQIDYIIDKTNASKLLANALSDKITYDIIKGRINELLKIK